ncbi:MAG: Nucleoside 2-deoxyribosyltransferase family protein [Bryobacterales bacterium]|nr:Nucleoside 2-deoxyribosyltransferase family protein [Bryobacterales bacterium]
MSTITVVGGVYHERCIWPDWDHVYGSGGRAASALSEHVDEVVLHTYARPETAKLFAPYADLYDFKLEITGADQTISFEYNHSLSTPVIRPALGRVRRNAAIEVKADVVLRFGMLEGSAVVNADRCVYDPQSAFEPEPFSHNGSRAAHLAMVANRGEILAMTGLRDPADAARCLLDDGVEVVVVKMGAAGALVVTASAEVVIPAYQTDRVWKIGSGDVFAAVFAARWGAHHDEASVAADLASRAVAAYVESMSLPSPGADELRNAPRAAAVVQPGRVYLASPFFTLGQRWLVDEARQLLSEFGLEVFSPVHDVGAGPAEIVAPADLEAFATCDRVFAILDGIDSGTLFEVGYGRAHKIPVYALAQAVPLEDLKMVSGSGCRVFEDFVTAVHHTVWKTS